MIDSVQSLTNYPLPLPHHPVVLCSKISSKEKMPIFVKPKQLPIHRPFGPSLEASEWEDLQAT